MRGTCSNVILKIIKEKEGSIKVSSAEKTLVISSSSSDIKEGEIVLLPRHLGTRFKYLDDELIVVDKRDIILCVKGVD